MQHLFMNPGNAADARQQQQGMSPGVRRLSKSPKIAKLTRCRGSGGGTQRATLQGMQKERDALPPPDAKPEYFASTGTVTFINPDQTMYYMAAPENNRKVGVLHTSGGRFLAAFPTLNLHPRAGILVGSRRLLASGTQPAAPNGHNPDVMQ